MNVSNRTVWLLYGNGVDSVEAFCPAKSDHPDEGLSCGPLYVPALRQAGFQVNFTNDGLHLSDVAAIISWDVSPQILYNLKQYPRKKCFLIQYEPPVVAPSWYDPVVSQTFGKIFTMMDDWVDGENYYKFHMAFNSKRLKKIPSFTKFADKKFCCLFNSNKMFPHPNELYSERRRAIQFFTEKGQFDLFGPGWSGAASWKGNTDTSFTFKVNTMKDYKFVICYENMGNQRGYVSEKLLDAFVSGCVPIYLGATNVTDYVPSETFIDRRLFQTYEDLYLFMKQMNEETYRGYLDAADSFLSSSAAQKFSFDHFKCDLVSEIKKSQLFIQ